MSHGLPTKAGDAVVVCDNYGHVIGAGTVERVTASGQLVVGYDRYTPRGSIIGLGRNGSIRLRTQADELPLARIDALDRASSTTDRLVRLVDDKVKSLSDADLIVLADHLDAAVQILTRTT